MSNTTDQNTLIGLVSFQELNSVIKLKPVFQTYYKMEGWNASTNQYENWHSQGSPNLTPPSGNSLIDISIVMTWQDR